MAAGTEPNRHRDPGDRAGAPADEKAGSSIKFAVPLPPSANNAFGNRKGGKGFGRFRTAHYHNWLRQADRWYMVEKLGRFKLPPGPYRCVLLLPRFKGDLDGRIKLLLDWMVRRQITPDDRHCVELVVRKGSAPDKMVWIELYEASPPALSGNPG
jgi:Holliday junction resolvase RusA-like endonuclease